MLHEILCIFSHSTRDTDNRDQEETGRKKGKMLTNFIVSQLPSVGCSAMPTAFANIFITHFVCTQCCPFNDDIIYTDWEETFKVKTLVD